MRRKPDDVSRVVSSSGVPSHRTRSLDVDSNKQTLVPDSPPVDRGRRGHRLGLCPGSAAGHGEGLDSRRPGVQGRRDLHDGWRTQLGRGRRSPRRPHRVRGLRQGPAKPTSGRRPAWSSSGAACSCRRCRTSTSIRSAPASRPTPATSTGSPRSRSTSPRSRSTRTRIRTGPGSPVAAGRCRRSGPARSRAANSSMPSCPIALCSSIA